MILFIVVGVLDLKLTAYLMGLESAVVVLEKSICLSPHGLNKMTAALKEMIIEGKINAIMNNSCTMI